MSNDFLSLVGIDYTLTSLGLTLHPNGRRSCVNIQIVDDLIVEGTEQFELTLQSVSAGVSFERQSTVVVIEDNDCKFFIRWCYFCYRILCG